MSASPLRYVPGPAVAVVSGPTAVLLDLDPSDPLVPRITELVLAGGGVDDVLDALVSSGLKALADFGAFQIRPDGVRMVVRGKVVGSVGELAGMSAEHTMWHDTWQPGAVAASLHLSGTESGPELLIGGGVVLAGSLASSQGAITHSRVESVPAAESAPAQAGPVLVESVAERAVEAARGSAQEPVGSRVEQVQEQALVQQLPAPEHDPSATMAAPLTIPTTELPYEPIPPAQPTTLITGMPWASADSAEVELDHSAPVQPAPPRQAAPPASPTPPIAPVPAALLAAPLADSEIPGFEEIFEDSGSVPSAAQTVDPHLQAPPQGAVSDHTDRTVSRSALAGLPPVVMVVAARCLEGHLSPAYAGVCRVCGAPIMAQQPVEIPRPTLGQLRLSTGGVVSLDRPLILGRNPRIPVGYTGEQPNLVRLSDPEKDVSGQHLEVSLDYWNVVVRDLGSTNGTEVTLPGEMPVALRANDPVIIEPGTQVVLAGRVSFVFEVLG